jgi:YVTN family beta-propeller protein
MRYLKNITKNSRYLASTFIVASQLLSVNSLLAATEKDFTLFESGQVRPLALTSDGNTLLSVNTPDNAIEVYNVSDSGLTHKMSIPVGLEPVSISLRSDTEAWVVNHLSDSISIIDLQQNSERVVRTLLVGDEPRDIVFAGTNHDQAYITTSHRGQNSLNEPEYTTPGRPRRYLGI